MDLELPPPEEVNVLVCAQQSPVDKVLGYVPNISIALGVVTWAAWAGYGLHERRMGAALCAGTVFGSLVLIMVFTIPSLFTVRSRLRGRDRCAGLPLAVLSKDGVRVRYRQPSPRERRRGSPASPAFDLAIGWDDVTGWYFGKAPHGQQVVSLCVADSFEVVLADFKDPYLRGYVDELMHTAGSAIAIRAPIAGESQTERVIAELTRRSIPSVPAPRPTDPFRHLKGFRRYQASRKRSSSDSWI